MRRTLGAALLTAALAAPSAAAADPSPWVGEIRTARAVVQLAGTDGRTWVVRLDVEGRAPLGGGWTYVLTTSFQPCATVRAATRCDTPDVYRQHVAGDQASVSEDRATAALAVALAGTRLDVTWATTGDSASTAVAADGHGARVGAGGGGPAGVSGAVLSVGCAGEGAITGERAVLDQPPAAAAERPLRTLPAALRRAGSRGPRCLPPGGAR